MDNINEVLDELKKDELTPELIQDNKLCFKVDDKIYGVRVPTQKENLEATAYKNKKYIQLIKEDDVLTIKQLTKLLKDKQDIDIYALDEEAKKLEEELMQAYLTLSKKKDSDKVGIEKAKIAIDEIREKRLKIILEKATFLAPALENQVQDDYYRFLTSLCAEKFEVDENKDETWENIWASYDEYSNDSTKLAYIALGKMTELMFGA